MQSYVLNDYQRTKVDNSPDSLFYSHPRYVHHLDENFRKRLTNLYRNKLTHGSIVLDIMSSWVSHLPNLDFKKVIGHGLNNLELDKNEILDEYWIQDLNITQNIPLESNSIDYCLMVAGWQYLQFPEELSSEIYRITNNTGKFIISFSNRAFWTKSPNVWIESSDQQRINYICTILESKGWIIEDTIIEENYSYGLVRFIKSAPDPFFSVIAYK